MDGEGRGRFASANYRSYQNVRVDDQQEEPYPLSPTAFPGNSKGVIFGPPISHDSQMPLFPDAREDSDHGKSRRRSEYGSLNRGYDDEPSGAFHRRIPRKDNDFYEEKEGRHYGQEYSTRRSAERRHQVWHPDHEARHVRPPKGHDEHQKGRDYDSPSHHDSSRHRTQRPDARSGHRVTSAGDYDLLSDREVRLKREQRFGDVSYPQNEYFTEPAGFYRKDENIRGHVARYARDKESSERMDRGTYLERLHRRADHYEGRERSLSPRGRGQRVPYDYDPPTPSDYVQESPSRYWQSQLRDEKIREDRFDDDYHLRTNRPKHQEGRSLLRSTRHLVESEVEDYTDSVEDRYDRRSKSRGKPREQDRFDRPFRQTQHRGRSSQRINTERRRSRGRTTSPDFEEGSSRKEVRATSRSRKQPIKESVQVFCRNDTASELSWDEDTDDQEPGPEESVESEDEEHEVRLKATKRKLSSRCKSSRATGDGERGVTQKGFKTTVSTETSTKDYSQRIADAALMKEQSEARHNILKEVRQAMEMRDCSSDLNDRLFWENQITTLNKSLKKLCINQSPEPKVPRPSGRLSVETGIQDPFQPQQWANLTPLTTEPGVSTQLDWGSTPASAPVIRPTPSVQMQTVKVQAPEDLPGGHQFTVRMNGRTLRATVPPSGVHEGDVFSIRIPPLPSSKSTVKVRAPASLPEGYRFTAKMGDRTIVATVPQGGVVKGQIFAVPTQSDASVATF